MRNFRLVFSAAACSAVVLIGSQAFSQTQPNSGQATSQENSGETTTGQMATPAKKVSRMDRIICHREKLTGTRLKDLRTCRTAREWREIERGFQRSIKDLQDKRFAR
ncbi:MAG: hypothetical protein FD128_2664 [Hyphomonadaceae bacterium]|nr:MAG: hypothetical protein FD128_2664 [Hyphomonadaceae bacterium]